MSEAKRGILRAREICENRAQRAQELKADGRTVMGYLCIYPPLEMLTALDIVPYRVFGDMQTVITEADRGLPVAFCPFVRSCLDLGIKEEYHFLDGMVTSHACDAMEKAAHVWERMIGHSYFHFIEIPTKVTERAEAVLKGELQLFAQTLQTFVGRELSAESLKKAITLHNEQRALVRELYEQRMSDPPRISGGDTLRVLKAVMSLPVEEGNELLREVVTEVQSQESSVDAGGPRLMIWGSIVDDPSFVDMVEEAGCSVVVDDTCVGSRAYWKDVPITDDPFDGLAHHYLADIRCSRTFFEVAESDKEVAQKERASDLESRFGYIRHMVEGWKVDGAILQSVKYCDTHGFDVPDAIDYFRSLGIPSTYFEHDYTPGSLAPLRTRVQGFLEIVG